MSIFFNLQDYSACPENYVAVNAGVCAPGLGSKYSKKLNFHGLTPMEKANYAAVSGVQFPCSDKSSFLGTSMPQVVNLHVKESSYLKSSAGVLAD